jgi:biotin synthase
MAQGCQHGPDGTLPRDKSRRPMLECWPLRAYRGWDGDAAAGPACRAAFRFSELTCMTDASSAPDVLAATTPRNDWTREEIAALFDLPFTELVYRAAQVHRENHPANEVQLSTLLSIKTGGCVEDCGYCSQSVKADSGVKPTKLMEVQSVLQAAARAKDNGSSRFCMGAAWRNPKDRDMPAIIEMVKGVRGMGLETCMTLGMLTDHQADMLAEAGLDYYNHNIDTSPERYNDIITTRTMEDRLDTLGQVRRAGINVCSGGIVGMGETREDRVGFVHTLATLPSHPQSVPVNALVPVKGTVLGNMLADTPLAKIDDVEFVRTVAVARITMPLSMVRLSAGRESMSEMTQAMCFMAGANSIFTGDTLLTAPNAGDDKDGAMFARLGIKPMAIAQTQADLDAERMPRGCAKLEAAE